VGCGGDSKGLTKANFDKIQMGMTPAEVGAIFGHGDIQMPESQIAVIKQETTVMRNGIDRTTSFGEMGEIYDSFSTKELGGVNKKEVVIRYEEGKVTYKDSENLQ
jgi:hypothetical protein